MTSSEQLKADVKSYAETLECVVSGAEWFYEEYCDDDRDEYVDSYARLSKYFEGVLDVEIICDLRGDYRGARIALAIGGPNIYFDTRDSWVKGYWGSDSAKYRIKSFAADAVDEYFSEIWKMTH